MIDASSLPLSMVALHNAPRYSREKDYMGFLAKKKTPRGAYALFCHADFILTGRASNFILHDPIHDPWSGPWSDLQTQVILGRFRTF